MAHRGVRGGSPARKFGVYAALSRKILEKTYDVPHTDRTVSMRRDRERGAASLDSGEGGEGGGGGLSGLGSGGKGEGEGEGGDSATARERVA